MRVTFKSFGHPRPEGVTDNGLPVVKKTVQTELAAPVDVVDEVYRDAMEFFESVWMCTDATPGDLENMSKTVSSIFNDPNLAYDPIAVRIRSMKRTTAFALVCTAVLEMAAHRMVLSFTNAPIFEHVEMDVINTKAELCRVFEIPSSVDLLLEIHPAHERIYVLFPGQVTLVNHLRVMLKAQSPSVLLRSVDACVNVQSVVTLDSALAVVGNDMTVLLQSIARRIM